MKCSKHKSFMVCIPENKINPNIFCFSLTYLYLCNPNEMEQRHIEDTDAAHAGRGHSLLDVPRRRLADHSARNDRRDGLDLDAAQLPLRHSGTDVPRLAMATDAGARR